MALIIDTVASLPDVDPDVVLMIRNDYSEQPGLRLDQRQAARFFSLPQAVCDRALQALTETRFLARDGVGRYHRA